MDLSKIDVEDFLLRLGIQNVKPKGVEVFYSCPFEGHSSGDLNPSTSMQQGSTMFNCFGCGMKGNAIHFLAEFEKISPIEAKRWIRKEFFGGYSVPDGPFVEHIRGIIHTQEEPFAKERVLPTREFFRSTQVDWEGVKKAMDEGKDVDAPLRYMIQRGFTPETLESWGIGYDVIGDRITIPIQFKGDIVGFKARATVLNNTPRYKVLGGFPYEFDTYDTSSYVYGLEYATAHKSIPIVCEGELNALAMWQMGFHGACGISGKHISPTQARQIVKHFRKVCLLMDEEKDAIAAAEVIGNRIPTYIVKQRDWDPADLLMRPDGPVLVNWALDNAPLAALAKVQ